MTGKFIVIEGLEGAGKSTAIDVVKKALEEKGISYITTREPGGTPMAEAIRECVKHPWDGERVTIEAELMLMYAARAQLLQNVILPSLSNGTWVVGDRHDLSSRAYQGGGRMIPMTMIDALRQITLNGFQPDLTLYLDVEPEIGLARARSRGALDRIEQEEITFFRRTRDAYLQFAHEDPRIKTVNTMQAIEDVHSQIQAQIKEFLE